MSSKIKILTDLDCELWIDQNSIASIKKGEIYKYDVLPGKYIIEFRYYGNILKYFDYQISDNYEDLIVVKLTKNITIDIHNDQTMLYGCLLAEGDRIYRDLLDASISFDGINWEDLSMGQKTYNIPINYCGVSLRFNYGDDVFYDCYEKKHIGPTIHKTYTETVFFEKYIQYSSNNIFRKRKFIASLNPYCLSKLQIFEDQDVNIYMNISWLNIQNINAIFTKINDIWKISEFENSQNNFKNVSILSSVESILGIDLPFMLVSNTEKLSVYNVNKNELIFPYEYDDIYNERSDNDSAKIKYFCFLNRYNNFKIKWNNLIGIADTRGNIIVEPKYKNIFRTHVGFIANTFDDNCNWIVLKNNERFDDVFSFHFPSHAEPAIKSTPDLGLTVFFEKNGYFGWWNKEGQKSSLLVEEVMPTDTDISWYDFADEELFYAKKNNKWGLVSRIKGLVIPFLYDKLFAFTFKFTQYNDNELLISYDTFIAEFE